MNLLVKKTGLLLILGALFFFSCKDSSELLLDTEETTKIQTSLLDTFSINSSTVLFDSIKTSSEASGEDYMLFGNYNDPVLGNIETYSVIEVGAPTVAKPKAEAELLSFQLELDLEYQVGSTSPGQKFSAYVLKDSLLNRRIKEKAVAENYLATSKLDDQDLLLLSQSGATFNPKEDPKTKKVLINLDPSFGNMILDNMKNNYDSTRKQGYFRTKILPALRLVADPSNNSVMGAYRHSDSSRIILTYQVKIPSDTSITKVILPLSAPYHFNHVSVQNRSVLKNSVDKTYIQSSTGILTKISIPHLKKLREYYPKISINYAELIIEPETGQTIGPPSNLFLIRSNEKSDLVKEPSLESNKAKYGETEFNYFPIQSTIYADQQSLNFSALNIPYRSDKKWYKADITSYIESYLKSTDNNSTSDFIILPQAKGNFVSRSYSYTLSTNSVNPIGSFDKDLTINFAVIPKNKIKLKVYYTLVD